VHRELSQCDNVLKLLRVYESKSDLYLMLEYQAGGTLFELIRGRDHKVKEKDLQEIMA
jgi:serine/threonine protein kinase